MQSLYPNTRDEKQTGLPEGVERIENPSDAAPSNEATRQSQERSEMYQERLKSLTRKIQVNLLTFPPPTPSSDTEVEISDTSSRFKEIIQKEDDMEGSKASLDENMKPSTILDPEDAFFKPFERPFAPKNTKESIIPPAPPVPAPAPAAVPPVASVPVPQAVASPKGPQQTIYRRESQDSLLSCEREFLKFNLHSSQDPEKASNEKPAPWGQDIPRFIPPERVPDVGFNIPFPENPPYEFTLPICEAWLQSLTDGNIRFPAGRIQHPTINYHEPASKNLFGRLINVSIPSDRYYVFHCHDLIEFATIWLIEFQKVQDTLSPELRKMNALNPGNFTPSKPFFYGVHDPNPTKGKRDFIDPHVRGVWTGERVEYNRATFLSKIFEECPSSQGKVNIAATICLMAIYSQKDITVITSLGALVNKSRDSLFIREGWAGRFLSDGGYIRLARMADGFFKYVYMRFRRLHKISPSYEYTSFENRDEKLKGLARAILKRDGREDVLGRKTPIHWKRMRSDDYLAILKKCLIEGEREDARREQIRQSSRSDENTQPSTTEDTTASTETENTRLSCCTIFPLGKVNITKALHSDQPHEDQLWWFLLSLYHPEIHSTLTPLIVAPQNAMLTTPWITDGFHDLKAWLDPYVDSDDEEEKERPKYQIPDFEKIFHKRKAAKSPVVEASDAIYKLYNQTFEAHRKEGCFPVPNYGWEMYPHLVHFKAREGIPLPSPGLLSIHRAVAVAATESGAWGAGDEILEAEEKKWCDHCKTDRPHYCLLNSMEFPEEGGKE
ncbi:hypothetical protein TWF281_007932 [Arthrobotrys megalospora]